MRIEDLIISPKTLAFAVTYRCTASCKNCCFGCNPQRKKRLSLDEMKSYVDQAITYYGDSIRVLVLTGGECFLLKEDLPCIIEYGNSKGLATRVVTNGYWASTYEKSYKILLRLRECGLKEINFSTGDDHLQWVSYENIVNGTCASMDLGLTCALNVECHEKSQFNAKVFLKEERFADYFNISKYQPPLLVEQGIWMPFDKKALLSYEGMEIETAGCKRCSSIFSTIAINPYSVQMSCCGLMCEYLKPLRLGFLCKDSMKTLYELNFKDLIKIWLFTEGPHAILEYIYNKRHIDKSVTGHICYICAEIFKDIENIQWIIDHYEEIMPIIMLKYILLKQSITN